MSEPLEIALALIADAAANGLPCPSNVEIARVAGRSGPVLINAMEDAGLIEVTRYADGRQVRIVSTGAVTRYRGSGRLHWTTDRAAWKHSRAAREAAFVRLYRDEKMSLEEINTQTGASREVVRKALAAAGIEMRTNAPRPKAERPKIVRPARPAAPIPAAPRRRLRPEAERNTIRPILGAGMVWCGQCDRKVAEVRARACASPFCNAEVAR